MNLKKALPLILLCISYFATAQTGMFDYLNKSEARIPYKYSVPHHLVKAGKDTVILDSIDVKYFSKSLFHLDETELYSHYQNFDMIRLIIKPAFQTSMLIKIIHIKNYDSLW